MGGFEEKIENYKLNLTKFHSILLGNHDKSEEIDVEKIKKIKEEIYQGIEKDRARKMIEGWLEIRLGLLKGKVENRRDSLKKIIEIDVLKAKEEENFDSLNKMIGLNDHTLSTCLLAVVSMIASCEEGISYLTGGFAKPELILTVFKVKKFDFVLNK